MSEKQQRRVEFQISIRSAYINIPDETELQILWIRGAKKIDTRIKTIKNGKVSFNEKFQMKTALDFDSNTGTYLPKPVILKPLIIYRLKSSLS